MSLSIECGSPEDALNLLKLLVREGDCSSWIDCENTSDSLESIVKRLVSENGDGTLSLNICGEGLGGLTIVSESNTISIANSNAETTIYEIEIPASTLVDNFARGQLEGEISNQKGSGGTIIWRIYYGATLMYQCTSPNIPNSVNDSPFRLNYVISPLNESAVAQLMNGVLVVASGVSAPTTGKGDMVNVVNMMTNFSGQSAEDATSALNLRITAQLSASDPAFTLDSFFRELEHP